MVLNLIILILVALLVIADWPRIRRALVRLGFGRPAALSGLKKGELWLCPEPARILPHESRIIIGASALVILVLSFPAFSGFFIAEDFTYLGLYRSAGNHFLAGILTPFQHLFFRPSAAAWYLIFNHFLPVEPWAHHLRNYLTTVAAAALLYALSRRLVASPVARGVGVAFFAVSKVHLTTIGYINCNDSIMSLIQIEAVLWFLLVYFQTGRSRFLYLAYVPYTLEVFSRDYGMAVFAVVATAFLVQSRHVEAPWRFIASRLAPFAGIAAVYFLIRTIVMQGDATGISPYYRLTLSPGPILYRAWLFAGNLFNVSLGTIEVTGSGSFATVLHAVAPGIVREIRPWDAVFVVLASALVIGMTLRALLRDERLWIPIVWAAVFIGPSFLIANIQMYYVLEPLAGVALTLAMVVGTLRGRYWPYACVVVLGIVAINTAVESRSVGVYSWRFCANAARRAYDEAMRPYLGRTLRSWTLLVPEERQVEFWAYTLTGNGSLPMIPALLNLPNLQAKVMLARTVTPEELPAPDAPVYLVSDNHLLRVGLPAIVSVVPPGAAVGAKFNVQPDGNAAIWVNCRNALPTTVILWNGDPLATTFASDSALSALVPAGDLSKPGTASISLRDRLTGVESAIYPFPITNPSRPGQ
jgi:hypothetical protein